jgi:3-hydroxypropanoate dehydrogenase
MHQSQLLLDQSALEQPVLDQLFLAARSVHTFTERAVTDETLRALYTLLKMGPTAFNSQPGRYVFVRTLAAKQRLVPHMMASNQEKTLKAPVTVIVALDSKFYEQLDVLFPALPNAKMFYVDNTALSEVTALRNSTLQGAYLLLAARALGLSVGPMSGFDNTAVDKEFFPDGQWRSNFIVNMGYYDGKPGYPRGPRLAFEQAAQIL